eukprot:GHVS01001138.1.p1 GENE.GHVS01001138.1~~GHVS01001138.1.p1  ORF type:complete len:419 (-),score=28.26 GHVS01001138.1:121-1377(-)
METSWKSSLMLSDKVLMFEGEVDHAKLRVVAVRWDEYTFRVPKGTTNWTYKAIPVDYYHPRYFVIPCTLPIQDEMSAVYLGKGDGSFRGETKFSTRVVMHWAGHLYAAVFPPTVMISSFEKKEVKNIPNVQLFGEGLGVKYVRDNEMWLSFDEVTYRALFKFEASNGDAVYLEFKDKMIDPHPETKTDISVFVDAWPTARPLFVITQDELKQPPKEFVQTLTNKCQAATNAVAIKFRDGDEFVDEGKQAIVRYNDKNYPVDLFNGFNFGELEFLLPSEVAYPFGDTGMVKFLANDDEQGPVMLTNLKFNEEDKVRVEVEFSANTCSGQTKIVLKEGSSVTPLWTHFKDGFFIGITSRLKGLKHGDTVTIEDKERVAVIVNSRRIVFLEPEPGWLSYFQLLAYRGFHILARSTPVRSFP